MLAKLIGKKLTTVDRKYFDNYVLKRKTLEELEELINLDIFKKNPNLLSNAVLKYKVENINKVYELYSLFNIQDFITSSHLCLNYNEAIAKINYLIDNNLPLVYIHSNNKIKINPILIARGLSFQTKTGYSTEEIIKKYLDKKLDILIIEEVKKDINGLIENKKNNEKIKFDKKMVLNYINGNEDGEYNFKQLENDEFFMSEVIRLSKDKKFYENSSDELKCSYLVVLKTIKTFCKDIKFIKGVADYFLVNATLEDNIRKMEINIIMDSLIKDKDDSIRYRINAISMYEDMLINFRKIHKEDELRGNNPQEYGLGFVYIYDFCLKYPIILEFSAKKMIENIFFNSGKTLKEIIYDNYINDENNKNLGLQQFVINYIYAYDEFLSNYVAINKKIIDDIVKVIYDEVKNCTNFTKKTI